MNVDSSAVKRVKMSLEGLLKNEKKRVVIIGAGAAGMVSNKYLITIYLC